MLIPEGEIQGPWQSGSILRRVNMWEYLANLREVRTTLTEIMALAIWKKNEHALSFVAWAVTLVLYGFAHI